MQEYLNDKCVNQKSFLLHTKICSTYLNLIFDYDVTTSIDISKQPNYLTRKLFVNSMHII